jgi:MoaA/NifB/PqqE/SkfB family radical SAM enzyme
MCDIWKANRNRTELSVDDLAPHLDALRRLGCRWVVLSGGEPLMHSNLWRLCESLEELGVRITLLSTGLLISDHAADIVRWCDEVIVSLDGPRDTHDAVRRVPGAWGRLADGVRALREIDEAFPVTARCVVQKQNHREISPTIGAARELGLDGVSFLAADTTSTAFNRPDGWSDRRVREVALDPAEVGELAEAVEIAIREHRREFDSGFVAESPEKLRDLVRHYASLRGDREPETRRCNAPWVSAVIEADGTVRPCFFHRAFGNIGDAPLDRILHSSEAAAFRRDLDVARDPVCRHCVCTLWFDPASSTNQAP